MFSTRNPLGIDMQTVFALPPVDHVRLAAELGCQSISIGLQSFPFDPEGFGAWSLRDDLVLRRALVSACRDNDVVIALGEGCNVRAGLDVSTYADDLDIMAEIGVRLVNVVSLDPDLDRTFDQFAGLAEMIEERGMRTSVELCPSLPIANLDLALAAFKHGGGGKTGLLIDMMHFCRSGGTAEELGQIDPGHIFYVQLCDASKFAGSSDYFEEAMNRLVPGEGDLPLVELLAAVPSSVPVSLEVPQKFAAETGGRARDRAARCIAATRTLLSSIG